MKSIDVETAQQVAINYSLAGVMQRILAFIIDSFAIGVIYYILVLILVSFFPRNSDFSELYVYLIILPIIMFYHLLFEYFMNGQSLGKRALGIRVIKTNGERPEFIDYLTRWMFRLVDITFSSGIVAVVAVLSTNKSQRLGDIIANTVVIQVQNPQSYKLNDVLKMINIKDYDVSFNMAKNFSEEQMLVVKETLDRYQKFPNETHMKALNSLSAYVAKTMDVKTPQGSKSSSVFLKTVLRDYVYLTR
ncbi:MAG: RDD family protein [Bacteroidetes bacterium]|nr:RDD family protein [Bacteroidota bacterium]